MLVYYPGAFAFEIKPATPFWLTAGRAQLEIYLGLLANNDKRGVAWRPGTPFDYCAPIEVANAIVFPPCWGVIQYYWVDPTNALLRRLLKEAAEELQELIRSGELDWGCALQTASNIESQIFGAIYENAQEITQIGVEAGLACGLTYAGVQVYTAISTMNSAMGAP
jgi:hypothetical protein